MRATRVKGELEQRQNAGGVFHRYSGYIRRVLRYFGVDDRDVPDTSQDVLIVVHRKLDQFHGQSDIKTWLYRICANTASNYRRRAHRHREWLTDAPPERPSADDPHQQAVRRQGVERLANALSTLSEAQRRVFVMYELQQRTMSDIAAIEGCPLKTAFSRLYAARRHLIEELGPKGKGLVPWFVVANGRWIDTPGIECGLQPLQPLGAAPPSETLSSSSNMLSSLLGRPSLASLGMAAMAVCFMTLSPGLPVSTAPPPYNSPTPATPAATEANRAAPMMPAGVKACPVPQRTSVEVETLEWEIPLARARTKARSRYQRPLLKAREPSANSATPVPAVSGTDDEGEPDMVVYRSGEVDLRPSIAPPLSRQGHQPIVLLSHQRPRPIILPHGERFTELAEYTEQQLAGVRGRGAADR